MILSLDDFQYDLPEELIAQYPATARDDSRLMVVNRGGTELRHARFADVTGYLPEGTLLVLNDTRVVPARLYGRRDTGGLIEVVLLEPPGLGAKAGPYWIECLTKPSRRLKPGNMVVFGPDLEAEVVRPGQSGTRVLKFNFKKPPDTVLDEYGLMPLPPYIKRDKGAADSRASLDRTRYQTIYARHPGSVAAPTAGLHFTPALLDDMKRRGVEIVFLTLDVGYGTFAPIREKNLDEHRMHSERVVISDQTARTINRAKSEGRPVVAVGTTVVRSLEYTARSDGFLEAFDGQCDLFIRPGYQFKVVDHMITNFHLPGSTLLMLTAAFAGLDFMLSSYKEAVARKYRFFSYGDAMFIL